MAVLTKKEQAFLGLAEDAGLNYLMPQELTTRRTVVAGSIPEEARVTYSFSHAIRSSRFVKISGGIGAYGATGFSFRLLYEFLCEAFNSGESFIDTYFERIFDTRSVSDELNQLNDGIINEIDAEKEELVSQLITTKNGALDQRYSVNKRYTSLKVWKNPVRKTECARVASDIKRDIVSCLSSGRIPLRKNRVASSTLEARKRFLGIDGNKFFYASGQLIEHLSIFVELSEA